MSVTLDVFDNKYILPKLFDYDRHYAHFTHLSALAFPRLFPPTMTDPTLTAQPACSPLEQEVLDEYSILLSNLNKVCPLLPILDQHPSPPTIG